MKIIRPILISILSLSAAFPAEEAAPITLDRGVAYELTWDGKRWAARIYVTPVTELREAAIVPSLRSISAANGRTDPGLTKVFEILPPGTGKPVANFDLVTNESQSVAAGVYDAAITFRAPKTDKTKELEKTVTIQVTVPAGTLAGPAALQLTKLLWSPFAPDNPKIALWESSGKSPVEVQVQQTEPFGGADKQIGAQINLPATTVAAGKSATLNYTLDGDFPVGTVASKISLSSRQLAAPLVIPVQVTTKLTRFALLAVLIIGLAIGFVTRIVLKPRIELGDAIGRATAADEALAAEAGNSEDNEFRDKISQARRALQTATSAANATVATIAKAITDADAARQKAFTDLQNSLKVVETKINGLSSVAGPAWTAPAAMQTALLAAKGELDKAKTCLASSDAGTASKIIEAADQELRTVLVRETSVLKKNVNGLVAECRKLPILFEIEDRESFEKGLEALADDAAKAAIAPAAAGDAELVAALGAVHRVMGALGQVPVDAKRQIETTFEGMDSVLGAIALPEKNRWDAARESTEKLVAKLGAIVADDPKSWAGLSVEAQSLRAEWRQALVVQEETKSKDFAATFDAGHFERAALGVAEALGVEESGATLGNSFSLPDDDPDSPKRPVSANGAQTSPDDGVPPTRIEAPNVKTPVPFSVFGAKTAMQLVRDKAMQAAISGVALALVGYLIFADKFVGTSGDLMAAFFWGFTTDIGVDALLAAAKPKQGG